MRNFMDFDPVPIEEDIESIGPNYDVRKAKAEALTFRDQLYRIFPPPHDDCSLRIHSNPHDFGSYLSVRAYYDDENSESMDWVLNIENNTPLHWDEEAKQKLQERLQAMREL